MVNWTQNIWDARGARDDGKSRAHVPPQPVWSAFGMRIVQLVLAFIILVMTAYAADKFGTSDLAGFGLAWFTFILTLGYIVYLGVSLFVAPHIYHYWAQLALESLLVIFWLCTWAVLASEAAALSPYGGLVFYYGSSWRSAVNCMKASAALGALLWVTFIITLVFFVMALLNHRRTTAAGTGPVSDKPVIDGPVEMQNQQQPAYPQQAYQPPVAHQDSPYETTTAATTNQQAYPVQHEQQQQQQQFEQQAPYPVDHQAATQGQQAYAVPEQQPYVPDNRQPHQQV
jgi:hypothetical protein